ncbi:Probable ATP-dependent RNA helicase DHX34 [Geodia barretti]|nr:Probable ATP-dependent RNA helicase DHX34 [Geodia barretti]
MSATINIQLFSGYFDDAPVIKVPGRLYPIDLEYVPLPSTCLGPRDKVKRSDRLDPKPYLQVLRRIDEQYPANERGDMLVFLSGMNEIASLMEEVKTYAQQTHRWIVLALHSALSIEEQDKVFDVSPDGIRKCILSTNIAETSITIDGIRFVVDSGKVKEMSYDSQAKMRRLQEFWISRASAEQRKGRAGRTGPGVCYRMYSDSDYDSFSEYSTPEIMRVPLDSLVLQLTALGVSDVRKFPFIEPPSLSNIETSLAFLKEQGALYWNERLTPIGRMLAQLPVDIVVGKMLIMGTLFHVIEPVLTMAAALSVQSPFSRVPLGQNDITVARRPLESEHGDPFTLLNAFEEWVELKGSGGSTSSHQWCRRRGLEQQRFYEMAKLRQQFQEILQEHGLLGDRGGGMRRRGRGERLTDEQLTGLRQARKRHRTENRKRKMLRMDEEGGAQSDSEEVHSGTAELRDLEFKLFHNLSDLQEASALRQSFSLRDLNVLKLVVCSGLYPQLAISDDCNSYRKDSDQVFHTKSKQFVVLHPTSVFATNPEYIDPGQRKSKGSTQPELLSYVDLLETNKPYLVNSMRAPALQTLTLFSQNIDTNSDCTRLVVEEWLELKFVEASSGQQVVSCIQTLRNTWSSMLEAKLESSMKRGESERDYRLEKKVSALEELLASKLAEFLDGVFSYSLSQLSSVAKTHLYKGPPDVTATTPTKTDSSSSVSFVSSESKPHPLKGGWIIQEYLTYDCLLEEGLAAARSDNYLRRVWSCPTCGKTLVISLAEQLQHQASCLVQPQTDEGEQLEEAASAALTRDYHCPVCGETKRLSSIGILKHKRMHAQQQQQGTGQ